MRLFRIAFALAGISALLSGQEKKVGKQTVGTEDGRMSVVRAYLGSNLTDGFTLKQLYRMGDSAAVALTKLVKDDDIGALDTNRVLGMIHLSFASPKLIETAASDREPKTTLLVLHYLEAVVRDPQLSKEIAEARQHVLDSRSQSDGTVAGSGGPRAPAEDAYNSAEVARVLTFGIPPDPEAGHLDWMGDAAGVAVTKILEGRTPGGIEIANALETIRKAFEHPMNIADAANRDPRTTVFLLRYLRTVVEDPHDQHSIANTNRFVLQQRRVYQPTSVSAAPGGSSEASH